MIQFQSPLHLFSKSNNNNNNNNYYNLNNNNDNNNNEIEGDAYPEDMIQFQSHLHLFSGIYKNLYNQESIYLLLASSFPDASSWRTNRIVRRRIGSDKQITCALGTHQQPNLVLTEKLSVKAITKNFNQITLIDLKVTGIRRLSLLM